jgi:tetratricopeptide (TPR) repeat protein
MRGWRYPLAFAGLLAGLGGAIFLAFRSIQSLEPAREASPGPLESPGPRPVTAAERPLPPQPVPIPADSSRPSRPAPPRAIPSPPAVAIAPEPPVDPRRAALDSAYLHRSAGRDAEALAVLSRWLAAHGDDHPARREVARLKLALGDTAGAWIEYAVLTESAPDDAMLAEYAAALLANGRPADAAARYAALLARDSSRLDWRLGAARGRVWSGRPRDALAVLGSDPAAPGSELAALRRQARVALDLTESEAVAWIADDSSDAEAHLALARALARDGSPRRALIHYERAVSIRPAATVLTEMAGVASAIPDSVAVADALRRAVALAPDDQPLRRRYAQALAWAGDQRGAIEELDRLVAAAPAADLLQLRGDLNRWSGDRRRARADYRAALALDPAFAPARQGMGHLAGEVLRDVPWADDEGTSARVSGREDSEGFSSVTVRAAHGVPLGFDRRAVVSAAGEYRWVGRNPTGPGVSPSVVGWGGDLGFGYRFDRLRLDGRLGMLAFSGAERTITWRLGAVGTFAATGWRAGLGRAPVYETLRAGGTLGPGSLGPRDTALVGTAGELTITRRFGSRLELWSRAERLGLGDGNRRTTLEAAVRLGLAPSVNLVYGGGLLGFGDPSSAYWSPSFFTLHSLGLEYRRLWPSGVLVSLQALPGLGYTRETLVGGGSGTLARNAFQWQLGGEVGLRRDRWDLGGQGGWGRDRGGLYSSWFWTLRARYRW